MAMFNSYVKLPEGIKKRLKIFAAMTTIHSAGFVWRWEFGWSFPFPLRIAIVGVTKGIQSHFQTPKWLWLVKHFPISPFDPIHSIRLMLKSPWTVSPKKLRGLDPYAFSILTPVEGRSLNRSGHIVMEPPTATSSSDHRKRSKPPSAAWTEQESDIAN